MIKKILDKTIINKIKILLFVACIFAALIFGLIAALILSLDAQVSDAALDAKKLSLMITEPWDGKVGVSFAGGKGSLKEPYRIFSGAELAFLAQEINKSGSDKVNGGKYNDSSKYYILTNDIYLNDTAEWGKWGDENPEITALNKWIPIGKDGVDFEANFDGGGFSVFGVYINDNFDSQALFGSVYNGKLSNLDIEQSYIKGKKYVGGVVGWFGGGSITNCSNAGTVFGSSGSVAGVAGYAGRAGCLVNCYNFGFVSGFDNVGGIAGHLDQGSRVINCYNTGDILSENSTVGGVVGYVDYGYDETYSVMQNCYSTGRVLGQNKVGGVAGYVNAGCTVSHCYFLQTADINSKLAGANRNSDGIILNVSAFNQVGEFTLPLVIESGQFSCLTAALNAYVSYENENPDNYTNPDNYELWRGKPFPNFNKRTPTPDYIPTELTAVYKSALSAVNLTCFNDDKGQWKWETPSADVGTAGTNNFTAIYTPNNTADYDIINLQLPITVNPKPLTNELKPFLDEFTYNGSPQTPLPTVEGLELNVDYIVTYSDNINPGTAQLTIIGIGNYSGELSVNFTIAKANGWAWYYTVIICSVTVLCAAVAVFYAIRHKRRVERSLGLLSSSAQASSLSSGELEAVRVLIRGGQDKTVNQSALAALPGSLTLREREVAGLLLAGQRSKEIAEKLFISNHTVKNHIQNILHKTNCPDQLSFIREYEDGGCL